MAKKEPKKLEYFTDWKYAPSPEATDHIRLQKQYDLFSPGLNEWPALLRRCDAKDPSYKEQMTKINSLNDIVKNGLCIGCGICQCIAGKNTLKMVN